MRAASTPDQRRAWPGEAGRLAVELSRLSLAGRWRDVPPGRDILDLICAQRHRVPALGLWDTGEERVVAHEQALVPGVHLPDRPEAVVAGDQRAIGRLGGQRRLEPHARRDDSENERREAEHD